MKMQATRHRSAVLVGVAGQSTEQFCGRSPAPVHQSVVVDGLSWATMKGGNGNKVCPVTLRVADTGELCFGVGKDTGGTDIG